MTEDLTDLEIVIRAAQHARDAIHIAAGELSPASAPIMAAVWSALSVFVDELERLKAEHRPPPRTSADFARDYLAFQASIAKPPIP